MLRFSNGCQLERLVKLPNLERAGSSKLTRHTAEGGILAGGGLGGFIDFLIGKAGQEKAKDFLLK